MMRFERRSLKPFYAALRFITVLPIGPRDVYAPRDMIAWFPVVGLAVGLLLAGFDLMVARVWSPAAAAVLDVVFLVGVTGAFHLDGLGDTADGLYGHWDRARALEIMKDSRIGTMALVAVVVCLAVKAVGIAGLEQDRWLVLLLVPAYARGAMVFGIRGLPYGRSAEGTGHDLFATPLTTASFAGLIPVVLLSFLLGGRALVLILTFVTVVFLTLAFYRRKMGCITGDMLGALTEITEAVLFLVMAARGAS